MMSHYGYLLLLVPSIKSVDASNISCARDIQRKTMINRTTDLVSSYWLDANNCYSFILGHGGTTS